MSEQGQPINRVDDPRWAVLGAYVREIADRMGLSRYYFNLSHDEPEDASSGFAVRAKVTYNFQTLEATLFFGDVFFTDCTPVQQRHTIVHELCHVVEIPRMGAIHVLRNDPSISIQLWNLWESSYDLQRERAIDHFAGLITPSMPLPCWEVPNGAVV